MSDILTLNGKPLNYIITKNKKAINLLSETGSLIVYEKPEEYLELNSEYNDKYRELWVSSYFLAGGYGANSREEQENLSYISSNYNNNLQHIYNTINNYSYNLSYMIYVLDNDKVSKGSYSYAGDDISYNMFNFGGSYIPLNDLYDKFKSIKSLYKFEIYNVNYEYIFFDDSKIYKNISNVPVGRKLKEIKINITGNTRDSGGIDEMFVELNNDINDSSYILSLNNITINSYIPRVPNNEFNISLIKTFSDNDSEYSYTIKKDINNIITKIQIKTFVGLSENTIIKPVESEIINDVVTRYPTYLIGNTTCYVLGENNYNISNDINNYNSVLVNNNQIEIRISDNQNISLLEYNNIQFISLLVDVNDNIRLVDAKYHDNITCKIYDIIDFILCRSKTHNGKEYIEYLIKIENDDEYDKNVNPPFLSNVDNNLYFDTGIIKFEFIESSLSFEEIDKLKLKNNNYWITWNNGNSNNLPL